jgi:hypothetical protein
MAKRKWKIKKSKSLTTGAKGENVTVTNLGW